MRHCCCYGFRARHGHLDLPTELSLLSSLTVVPLQMLNMSMAPLISSCREGQKKRIIPTAPQCLFFFAPEIIFGMHWRFWFCGRSGRARINNLGKHWHCLWRKRIAFMPRKWTCPDEIGMLLLPLRVQTSIFFVFISHDVREKKRAQPLPEEFTFTRACSKGRVRFPRAGSYATDIFVDTFFHEARDKTLRFPWPDIIERSCTCNRR